MVIQIKNVGFASYLKTLGDEGQLIKFKDFKNGYYVFESVKDEVALRIEYANDRCSRFDRNVLEE